LGLWPQGCMVDGVQGPWVCPGHDSTPVEWLSVTIGKVPTPTEAQHAANAAVPTTEAPTVLPPTGIHWFPFPPLHFNYSINNYYFTTPLYCETLVTLLFIHPCLPLAISLLICFLANCLAHTCLSFILCYYKYLYVTFLYLSLNIDPSYPSASHPTPEPN
jgi:hypothetical protein